MLLNRLLARYTYSFPKGAVALEPRRPRDSAKLLVYNRKTKKVSFDTFIHLGKYLPPRSLLVINDTKVLPARLMLYKATGGAVRVLFLETHGPELSVLADRYLEIGTILFDHSKKYAFTVLSKNKGEYVVRPQFPLKKLKNLFEKEGLTPLPPYLKQSPLTEHERRTWYQSVFARREGSVAAPTASLHFTPRLIKQLERGGHQFVPVTLHVGLGTFATLTEENIKTGKLHEEWFSVSAASAALINKAKKEKRAVIAVGTTALRVVESAVAKGKIKPQTRTTDFFIQEGYKVKGVDGLVTNFHVPQSSLLMLVSALVGRKRLLGLYAQAIRRKFKLFSFGDGMLIV